MPVFWVKIAQKCFPRGQTHWKKPSIGPRAAAWYFRKTFFLCSLQDKFKFFSMRLFSTQFIYMDGFFLVTIHVSQKCIPELLELVHFGQLGCPIVLHSNRLSSLLTMTQSWTGFSSWITVTNRLQFQHTVSTVLDGVSYRTPIVYRGWFVLVAFSHSMP